jgi:hypothetical protein
MLIRPRTSTMTTSPMTSRVRPVRKLDMGIPFQTISRDGR